jgi:hypothetical protein
MSLPAEQMLISPDDHLDIHAMPDAWSSGLPKEWRERGPHVAQTPEGPYWFCDSTWPHSRKALAESPLALHGSDVLRKVTCEKAARVYGVQV